MSYDTVIDVGIELPSVSVTMSHDQITWSYFFSNNVTWSGHM